MSRGRKDMPPGPGRKKGVPNKVTMEIREAFKNLIEQNTPNMIGWMEEVAETDPAKALSLCADLAEFIVPKLSRAEHTGENGGPIKTEASIKEEDRIILQRYLEQQKEPA